MGHRGCVHGFRRSGSLLASLPIDWLALEEGRLSPVCRAVMIAHGHSAIRGTRRVATFVMTIVADTTVSIIVVSGPANKKCIYCRLVLG